MRKQSVVAPYAKFGKTLTEHRLAAGIPHQSTFASLVRSTQQTVSRWESGQSRPRLNQIGALARALGADETKLALAAGYMPSPVTVSYDQPFPIDSLSPDSFERFALHFLSALYPAAKVHRVGGAGHTQHGVDVDVIFDNDKRFHFQCKRVQEFGAAKVGAALRVYTGKAAKKIILLTRIASPKARKAICAAKNWDIWDKEDVALRIRRLARHEQIRLVDIFFKGQRLALLGETEPTVWQAPETFFEAFAAHGAFNHAWTLVGRSIDSNKLLESLLTPSVRLVLLVGTAGSGKTRVLKHTVETLQGRHTGALVHFLAPGGDVDIKNLEDLGAGDKILVVDDAHDYQDLKLLFQYVASPRNAAKLVLALRPYSLNFVKTQAANFTLFGERAVEVSLGPLTLEDATALAAEVLKNESGPNHVAGDIAKLTLDCPLATVMGAWVVSKERRHFEFLRAEGEFRALLMARFRDVIAGQISAADSGLIRKVLSVVALTQPIDIEDPAICKICEDVEHILPHELRRTFRTLIAAGILFRRGGGYRLSPDLLADYIIESECIGTDGASTGYAEQVFDASNESLLENVICNLGKLDWRRSNGDPSNSRLMDQTWRRLLDSHKVGAPHIRAVRGVAYYQPERALDFVEKLMRQGTHARDLPEILRLVAYNLTHLPQACEHLWELGKSDSRETSQHPEHAIRILAGLAEVEPNKPFEYNETMVDFALSLLDRPDCWAAIHTPLEVLKGIAKTEGNTTTSDGRTMSFSPYHVRPEFVRPLRDKVRSAAVGLLSNANLKVATRAAAFLRSMLQYPVGLFGSAVPDEVYNDWTEEFARTFAAIENAITSCPLDRLVLLELARTVSWHSNYSRHGSARYATALLALLPDDLEFRTLVAICDPNRRIFDPPKKIDQSTDWAKHVKLVTEELLGVFQGGEDLRARIEMHLAHIASAGVQSEPLSLYSELLQQSLSLAKATVENALTHNDSHTARFAAHALATIIRADREVALDVCQRFMAIGTIDLSCAVGIAHGSFDFSKDDHERSHLALIRTLLSSYDVAILRSAIRAVAQIGEHDKRAALFLILGTDFSQSEELIEDVFCLFHTGRALSFNSLTADDVEALLEKIECVPELEGYWVQDFLAKASQYQARKCAEFFRRRVNRAADTQDWHFRASNHGPFEKIRLQFRSSPEFGMVLRETSVWLKSRKDHFFQRSASELFEVMFRPFDKEIISLLDGWLDTADAGDIDLIGKLMRNAEENFVFAQSDFVARFLGRARQFGAKVHQQATNELLAAAVTGLRTNLVGEPCERDVRDKAEAENRLSRLSRLSPDYELYRLIREHSEREIARSVA